LEIVRTFGTILADPILRNELANAENEAQFIGAIREKAKQLAENGNKREGNNRPELEANKKVEGMRPNDVGNKSFLVAKMVSGPWPPPRFASSTSPLQK
jgi:hypothetical protein